LRRTASFDILSVKIGLTDSPVGEFKNQTKCSKFRKGGVYISPIWGAKTLGRTELNFFGGRRPRRNHAIQIWWRSVQGFWVGWGSNFAFSHILQGRPYNIHTIVWGVIWRLKDYGVTTLTFWGHVTLSVTWLVDSRWATSYGFSIVTMRLPCNDTEIQSH